MKLTGILRRTLSEIDAACREHERYFGVSWISTSDLSGTREERSTANIRKLADLGFVEGRKPKGHRQTQWRWSITEAGRAALTDGERDGD